MNLVAYVKGKRVPFVWNDISKPQLTKQRWDDLHAELLEAVLYSLPKQPDNKKRTNLALKITDQCMSVVGRELS